MKDDARQALIDELEEVSASKREHLPVPSPGRRAAEDVDMDDEGTMTGTGTPAMTPGMTPGAGKLSSGVNTDFEVDGVEDDEDDLFGDATDDGASVDTGAEGHTDAEGEAEGGEDDEGLEEMEDQDDEMARLLQQELGDLEDFPAAASSPAGGSDPTAAMAAMGVEDAGGEMNQADATAALESFAAQGFFDDHPPGSAPLTGFGVMDGGVGKRRLARGVEGVDDDDSSGSDNSDD